MSVASPEELLKTHWGYSAFRPGQRELIEAVVAGKDALGLLPTGGGKSLVYQIAGLLRGGLTLVISPLIALMQDQVRELHSRNLTAAALTSSQSYETQQNQLVAAREGRLKFLFVAPERLQSERFIAALASLDIRLLAVDEAHCISQWGFDFRPPYRLISTLRQRLPQVPVLALTATATPAVAEDIREQLSMATGVVYRGSFVRDNLRFAVLYEEDKHGKLLEIAAKVPGSGLVYVRTRRESQQLARQLQANGHLAEAYHAGLAPERRQKVQTDWLRGAIRIVVATNAFGMGINKPDVRFVVHDQLPADLESYYQEAGRAGRDGKTAFAVALLKASDADRRLKMLVQQYPGPRLINQVYQRLCQQLGIGTRAPDLRRQELDLAALARRLGLPAGTVRSAIRILNDEGWLALDTTEQAEYRVKILAAPEQVEAQLAKFPTTTGRVLDTLLRRVGGRLYDEFMAIEAPHLAQTANLPTKEFTDLLTRLQKLGYLAVQAPSTAPGVRFPRPRHVKLEPHHLNADKYAFLREQAERRLAAVQAYTALGPGCRMQRLVAYFGEDTTEPCGRCDLCTGRHAPPPEATVANLRTALILQLERTGPLPYANLLAAVQLGDPAAREAALRQLLDRGALLLEAGTVALAHQTKKRPG